MKAKNKTLLCIILSVGLLAGCVTPPPPNTPGFDQDGTYRYKPDDSVLLSLNEEQALDLLRQLFYLKPMAPDVQAEVGSDRRALSLTKPGLPLSPWTSQPIVLVDVRQDRIMVTLARGEPKVREFRYSDLPQIHAISKPETFSVLQMRQVPLQKDVAVEFSEHIRANSVLTTAAYVRRVADALYVLKRSAEGSTPAQEKKFAEAAAQYRSGATPPALPEGARRYKVQAESAMNERQLNDAARLYGEALKIAPWWPAGHSNRALILADLGRYREAISEMKRYLLLMPDAPNAREAQDKIYEWEDKVSR